MDTGIALWELDGVPDAPGVLGGAGRLCIAGVSGIVCRDPRSGAAAWQWQPVAQPPPQMGSLLFSSLGPPGVVATSNRLYWAAPTSAAPARADPPSASSTPGPGLFELRVTDLATGNPIANIPLPRYNGGPNGVGVSLSSPPGVVSVGAGVAFVSPQINETVVVEAIPVQT